MDDSAPILSRHPEITQLDIARLQMICGLLCRPAPEETHREELRRLTAEEDWLPPPRLRSVAMMEPLMRHHAISAGVDPEMLFRPFASGEPAAPAFNDLALNYHGRFALLRKTLAAFAEAGVAEILLVKGAALAPRYPTPALRPMSDLDLVARSEDAAKARDVLPTVGWKPMARAWLHPTGHQLDILAADSPAARTLWERATPHPAFGDVADGLRILEPDPADHLWYLSGHAVRHAGSRLWQDLSDMNLLLDNGRAGAVAEEALRRASELGGAPELVAMLKCFNEYARPVEPVAIDAIKLDSEERDRAEFLAEHLPALASDPISGTQIQSLLSIVFPRPRAILTAAKRIFRREPGGESPNVASRQREINEADRIPGGYWERQWAKIKLAALLIRNGDFRKYRRLSRDVRRMREARRVFRAIDPPKN